MAPHPNQIEQFNQDGYLICRQFTPLHTCDSLLALTHQHLKQSIAPIEYEADVGYPGAPASRDAPGGRTVRRLRNAYQRDPQFRALAEDPRIVDWLAQRFSEPACLTLAHHNCVMTKHPNFGTATGWHRDIRYWSFTRPDLVAVWLALGREAADNGGLRVIPGSHRQAIQPDQLDDLDFLRPDHAPNHALFERGIALELNQGDAVFFHSGLFHAAGRNLSPEVKCSLVFAYRGASNAPLPGTRSACSDVALSADAATLEHERRIG